jgi:hypothetical protein
MTITQPKPVSPKQEQELKELLQSRNNNTEKIGKLIVNMIESRPGGLDEKNRAAVFNYLHDKLNLPFSTLAHYVLVGRGKLLPEIFNLTSAAAHVVRKQQLSSAPVSVPDQRKLVFHGVAVVVHVEQAPVKRRLHELSENEAIRLIDPRTGQFRDTKQQRQLMLAVPPAKSKHIVLLWHGRNTLVRVRVRLALADLKYLVKELEKRGLQSVSDPVLCSQIDADLDAEFGPSAGATSPA